MAELKYNNLNSWESISIPNATSGAPGILKIQNNLTTTEPGDALDASQAQEIQEWAIENFIGQNDQIKVLWKGAWIGEADTYAYLNEQISAQNLGIILVFSYHNGTPQNYDWSFKFVPKHHVVNHEATGVEFSTFVPNGSFNWIKYFYISNDNLRGYTYNNQTVTANNVTVKSQFACLRYVLGI